MIEGQEIKNHKNATNINITVEDKIQRRKEQRKILNQKYYQNRKNNIFNKCIDGRITESER